MIHYLHILEKSLQNVNSCLQLLVPNSSILVNGKDKFNFKIGKFTNVRGSVKKEVERPNGDVPVSPR